MKIDRNSWHYKLWENWHNRHNPYCLPDSTTLCTYFWEVVAATAGFVISKGLLAFALTVYALLSPLIALVGILCHRKPNHWNALTWKKGRPFSLGRSRFYTLQVVWLVLLCWLAKQMFTESIDQTSSLGVAWLIVAFAFGLLFQIIAPCSIDRKDKKSKEKSSEPSLLSSYIQAKKDRVCPIIQFVDSKESSDD
jgi:hypothetical protein